jgi:DNA polymerase sigma
LQETMLNEVFTGGLSSYSIVNMVMTHLLCMGYKLPHLPGPAGTGPGFWGSLVPAPEQPEEDAGDLLISFLERFGAGFDYSRHAVSVGQVGCLPCICSHGEFAAAYEHLGLATIYTQLFTSRLDAM